MLCLAGTALVLLVTVTHAGLGWIALALFTQFLMGALAPALAGLGGQSTALPMAVSVLGLALAAAGCFLALCRPWRSTADPLAR